jgi:phosphate/sulfate permease
MRAEPLEILAAFVVAAADVVGTVVPIYLGVEAERLAIADLASGEFAVGAWLLVMGAVALFFGLELVGRRRLLPRLAGLVSRA